MGAEHESRAAGGRRSSAESLEAHAKPVRRRQIAGLRRGQDGRRDSTRERSWVAGREPWAKDGSAGDSQSMTERTRVN